MSNYDEIGRPSGASLAARLEGMIDSIEERESRLRTEKSSWGFEALYTGYMAIIAYRHLDNSLAVPTREYASRTAGLVHEYFCTDWADGEEAVVVNKYPGNEKLEWLRAFSHGLFAMLMLDDRRHQLTSICNWVECWMEPDYEAMAVEPLRAKLYISIAASFRTEPLEGLEEMEARFAKSRKKQPKLLFQAWDAARRGDQATFDKNIVDAIKNFEKRLGEIIAPWEALAFDASVVLAAGRALGMKLPEMEPRIAARVITAESVGLS